MKLLFDFFPILLFFIVYKLYGIYAATVVAIAASTLQVAISWFLHRKVETMHLVTLAIIAIFGGATLYLQDEMFIKWKPTVLNWLFGIAFLGSQLIGKKTIIERMMGKNMTLPEKVWIKLNMSWAAFFITLGTINLYVLYNYDTDTWVNFKLFGMLGLTLLFVVIQALFLARHLPEETEDKN